MPRTDDTGLFAIFNHNVRSIEAVVSIAHPDALEILLTELRAQVQCGKVRESIKDTTLVPEGIEHVLILSEDGTVLNACSTSRPRQLTKGLVLAMLTDYGRNVKVEFSEGPHDGRRGVATIIRYPAKEEAA